MDIIVRRAKLSDLKDVQDLSFGLFQWEKERDEYLNQHWSFEEDGEKYFLIHLNGENDNKICFVAEAEGKIIGYLSGTVMEVEKWRPVKRAELENIFIKEEYRNLQAGKMLFEEFKKWSKTKGVERIKVTAYTANDKALSFYKKCGFLPYSSTLEVKI